LKTDSHVVDAGGILQKRLKPNSGVAINGVEKERTITNGRVTVASVIVHERLSTTPGVVQASGIVQERLETIGRVVVPSVVEI
jgi:hypothetical protein